MCNKKPCPFCNINRSKIIHENETCFAIYDSSPVSQYHILILPKQHRIDYFDMTIKEKIDADRLIHFFKSNLEKKDKTIQGFNVGINCGEIAGQTVYHSHIHMIPRRKNDTPDPRGGVRGVIPDRMDYFLQ